VTLDDDVAALHRPRLERGSRRGVA
jgi:hypothetical protein